SVRSVMTDAVKNTFSTVDMTTYSAILRRYGCSTAQDCEETLRTRIQEDDAQLNRYYLIVLASAALAFILLTSGRSALSRAAVVVVAQWPHREAAGIRAVQVVNGRRDGAGDLHVLRRVQWRDRERHGKHAGGPCCPTTGDPHEQLDDPARLLLVHWILPGQHLS